MMITFQGLSKQKSPQVLHIINYIAIGFYQLIMKLVKNNLFELQFCGFDSLIYLFVLVNDFQIVWKLNIIMNNDDQASA